MKISQIVLVTLTLIWTTSALATNELEDTVAQLITAQSEGKLQASELNQLYKKHGTPLIDTLNQELVSDKEEIEGHWFAAILLSRINSSYAHTKLVAALDNSFFLVRMAAIKGLELTGKTQYLTNLHTLLSDKAMVVRAAAADSLAMLGKRDSLPHLVRELSQKHNFYKGKSFWVREHIIRAIGTIGGEESIAALVGCLQESEPTIVRTAMTALNPTLPPNWFDTADRKSPHLWVQWFTKANTQTDVASSAVTPTLQ